MVEGEGLRDGDTLGDAELDTGDGLTLGLRETLADLELDLETLAALDCDVVTLAALDCDGERLAPKDTDGEADALGEGGTHDSSVTLPAAPPLKYGVGAPASLKPRQVTPALAFANDDPPPPPHAPPPTLASMRGSDAL